MASISRTYGLLLCAVVTLGGVMTSSHAADGDFAWAKAAYSSSGNVLPGGVSRDTLGNIYVAGAFTGTVDFNPGAAVYNLSSSGAEFDVFVLKLSAIGDFVWARRIGSAGYDYGSDVGLDASNNVYVTGSFTGTVDFDPGAGTSNLTSAGSWDIFVLKLNSDGAYVWARRMGGTQSDSPYAIAVSTAGNVFTTGQFAGTADFNPGTGTSSLTSVAGSNDVFVSKLDTSGGYNWAVRAGGTYPEVGLDIALDGSGNVCLTGSFQSVTDFDPGAGTLNLTPAGATDAFVWKLTNQFGQLVWAIRMGGLGVDSGNGIAVSTSGEVFTTGRFEGTADFRPGSGTSNLISSGIDDIFVSKLDVNGNYNWAKRVGGTDSDVGFGIALDTSGGLFVTGEFRESVDFDPGTGTYIRATPGGGDQDSDVFILRLTAQLGDFLFAKQIGNSGLDAGMDITTTIDGGAITTGIFSDTVDFDPGPGVFNLSPGDLFVSKLFGPGPSAPSNPSAFEIALTSITWTWQDNSNNETGFKVYADPGVGPPTTLIATTGTNATARSYGSQGVNTQHAMQVQATISGNDSAKTSTITRWTLIEPVAGLALSNIGITSIDVAPTNTPSNLGSGSSGLRFVNTTAGTASTWQQNTSPWISDGLIPNTSYAFAGTSRNGAGVETAPAMASAWTLAATPLAPVLSNPTVSTLDLSVAPGDANPAGTQYALQDVSSGNWVQADGTLAASPLFQSAAGWGVTTLTGLAPATAYSYVAVARNGAGVLTASSAQGQGTTMDATAPDAIAITPATTGPTNATTVDFSVEFDEAVVNFNDASDLDIAHIGTSHGSVAFAGGPTVYTVTVSGISGDGAFTLAISTSSDVQNSLGTSLASSVTSAPVAIDNTAPGVTIGPPSIALTNTGPVTYSVEYSGADNIALGSGDITLNSTGSATASVTVSNSGTATRLVTLSGITGSGTLGISIVNPGTAVDLAGNASPTAGPSATFTVDNSAPQFSNLVVTPIEAEVGMVVTITFDVSKPLAGDPVVTINGSLTALSSTAPYTYVYTIESTDLTGPAMISISGTDLIGNVGSLTDTSALFIQNSVAKLPLKSWPAILALAVVGVLVLFRHRANRKDPA